MIPGVLLAVLAYGLFSCADALIKSTGGHLSIFEVGLFTALFGLIPAVLSKRRDDSWREALRFRTPLLLHLRGLLGVLGSACVIYAFTHVPMAEVYSLAFLAPAFVVLLSALLLKEEIPRRRWPLLMLSFVGVIIVVRPGFRELHLGHLAALACAFFTAANTILLRTLAPREHQLSIIASVSLYAITINAAGALLTGFTMPSLGELGVLAAIGLIGGMGHLTFINATRLTPANHVAPIQYTQMIWAIAFGAIFYREYIDLQAAFGVAILATAGILNVISNGSSGRLTRRVAGAKGLMLARRRRVHAEPVGKLAFEEQAQPRRAAGR